MSDLKAAGMICQIIKPILTMEDEQYLKCFPVENYYMLKLQSENKEYSKIAYYGIESNR
jgi:hypothetical protein